MREFRTQDGNIIHMPDAEQRPATRWEGHHCECHERLGNDFFFLPMGSCLRPDKVCDNAKGQALS